MAVNIDVRKIFTEQIQQHHKFSFELRDEQVSVIESVLQKKHTVGVFPTGFGKSICFLLPPLILDTLQQSKRHICIVISPLKSLMLDQCKHNKIHSISAAVVSSKDEMSIEVTEGIRAGTYSIIYMSPETLLNLEAWGDIILNSKIYKERVSVITIDEAHILESWGDTFRPTFARLGELRSHFPQVPFLLLTATCTKNILQHITSRIHLPNVKIFSASPDRQNIYLEYKKADDIFEELKWLFEEIKEKGIEARKTLIYVRSLGRGGCLFRDILGHLRESAYLHQAKGHHNSLIALYHAGMANKDLEYILHEFSKPDSILRLIICTIAFGMGINIPDIEVVVHWGACDSMMDYWQEVGRAGRDGRASKAMYYVTPRSILQTSDTMKELCKALDQSNITCFRDAILKHFTGYSPAPVRSVCTLKCIKCDCLYCKCCHLCRKACPCVKNSH